MMCLEAGKPVLCEKPLTVNAREARTLIDTARAHEFDAAAILEAHPWLSAGPLEIATRFGVPVVITLHDYYTSCPRAFRRRPGNAIEDYSCRRVLSAESCRLA